MYIETETCRQATANVQETIDCSISLLVCLSQFMLPSVFLDLCIIGFYKLTKYVRM